MKLSAHAKLHTSQLEEIPPDVLGEHRIAIGSQSSEGNHAGEQ